MLEPIATVVFAFDVTVKSEAFVPEIDMEAIFNEALPVLLIVKVLVKFVDSKSVQSDAEGDVSPLTIEVAFP